MIYLTGDFMSDLIDEIMNRRSIRKFKSDMVPKEDIDKIIKAGLYAPSGRGLQSPIIIAVTNKEFRDNWLQLIVKSEDFLRI